MPKLKAFLQQVTKRQWILMSYLIIHFTWFFIMEAINITDYIVIYSPLDDMIPFCEWFIFPYLLWFLYMLIPGVYYLMKDSEAFEKYLLSLFIGFFFSMLIITIWHSGQNLRVDIDPSKNIPSWIVAFIYDFDTNTNVFPSMHVVGALAVMVSLTISLKGKILWKILNLAFGMAIIAATVFLKQHSILDVFAALAVEIPVLIFVFSGAASKILDKLFQGRNHAKLPPAS